MANSYGPKGIVTDGLVFSADAGNAQCYTSGSATATDIVGGKTLTLENGSGAVIQPYNNSWGFDGSDDYINCGSHSSYDLSSITINAWAYSDSLAQYKRILQLGRNSGGIGYGIAITDSGNQLIGFWNNGSETTKKTTSTISATTWYHVVITFTGSTLKIYINGIDDTGDAGAGDDTGWASTNDNLEIARKSGGGQLWDGKIGDILIYNKVLTASEVLQNYNSQKARFGL